MKNYEKYSDEIRAYKDTRFCVDFILPNILKSDRCNGIDCTQCRMIQMMWLLEDYEEPETDWSKVEVDTPILVSDNYGDKWFRRYFAKYDGKFVYAWNGGGTSWSEKYMTGWKYAKLVETEGKTK